MLSPREIEILQAMVNRIIPLDDDPGGWEGGVGDYLARQFERDLKPLLPSYQQGLDALDAEARAVYDAPFDRLASAVQDELLSELWLAKIGATKTGGQPPFRVGQFGWPEIILLVRDVFLSAHAILRHGRLQSRV